MLNRRAPKHVNSRLPQYSTPRELFKVPRPMRRSSRRVILNFVFFISALLLICYFNLDNSSKQPFAWTTIRYKTLSPILPSALGICPGLDTTTKPALIVARITNDSESWLTQLSSKYHICTYTADSPPNLSTTNLQLPANRGHEAMAYLTFIIDNYSHLPASGAVFIHGSRFAWHNDHPKYDNLALLQSLNLTSALAPFGYHNLKCDWAASTCPKNVEPQGGLQIGLRKVMEPWNMRVVSDASLPGALDALFGDRDGGKAAVKTKTRPGRSDAVRAQCCAQFTVGRENIWRHTWDEYVGIRQWLLDGMASGAGGTGPRSSKSIAAHPDDRVAGRVLSYIWHILFMPNDHSGIDLKNLNQVACPSAKECYCRLYGRCGLGDCHDEGSCEGQYEVPPGFKLPEGWEVRYG